MIKDGDPEAVDNDDDPNPDDSDVDFSVLAAAQGQAKPTAVQPGMPTLAEQVRSRVPGMPEAVVYFDNWTHSSGNRRAFAQCKCHSNCRLYIFVHKFFSPEEAVSFLLAWIWAGPRWPERDQAGEHIAYKPPPAEVQDVQREQYAGSAGSVMPG